MFSDWNDGDEIIDSLKSPDLLTSGGSYVSEYAPMADVLNPAAPALLQRVALNINAAALFNDSSTTSGNGYDGTMLNLGASFPLRFGVITTSGYFIGLKDTEELSLSSTSDTGFQGGIKGGFSKEVYPGFLVGMGINTYFGSGWALTADLGVIKKQGDVGFMKNMKWGVVLGELGYSSFNTNDADAPSIITPGGGLSFDLVDTDEVTFNIDTALSFPGIYETVRLSLAGDLNLFDYGGLRFSSTMDLAELIEGDASALIPSFGLYFNFKTSFKEDSKLAAKGYSQNDVRVSAAAAPLANSLWAVSAGLNAELGVIDTKAPEIILNISEMHIGDPDDDKSVSGDDEDKTDVEADNSSESPEPTTDSDPDPDGGKGKKETAYKRSNKAKKMAASDTEKNNDKKTPSPSAELKDFSDENDGNIDEGPDGEKIIAYISPNNDGIKDSITIPISITDTRYIKGYSFIIEDSQGREVKRIENKDKRQENQSIRNFFKRLFYVEKGVDIPDSIRWDGTGEDGNVIADGFYTFHMEAWDDNGNTAVTEKYGFVVDNTPPEVVLQDINPADRIFSPNDDGNKDILPIKQDGTQEDLWTAEIKGTDGKVYRNVDWTKSKPADFIWGGKDDRKLLVPDGVYFYYIKCTDRAGNNYEAEIPNIIINTQSTPISLSVDSSYFAPGNNDAVNTVKFTPTVPVKTGIQKWSFKIQKKNGQIVKEYSEGDIPDEIVYTGGVDGGYIDEGEYIGKLEIRYVNGNNPKAESPVIVADKTAPGVSAKVSLKIFSPNGDGKKDSITVYQDTSVEDVWYGDIEDSEGNIVKKYKWVNNAATSFVWDGYNEKGGLAPDGDYKYRIYTVDKAGNKGEYITTAFSLDTEETPIMLTSTPEAFSPNGDDINEYMQFKPILNVDAGIQSYKLTILNKAGDVVKTFANEGRMKNEFRWDGVDDSGRKASDGIYKAALEVVYEKGDVSTASTRNFELDSIYPEIEISSDYDIFSPNQDGKKDKIKISQKTSNEDLITAVIADKDGNHVREFAWDKSAGDLEWDGTDSNGNKVKDGSYSYTIRIEDKAGNVTSRKIDDIEVDNRQTTVFVTAGSKGITPNGDGENDSIEFATMATLKEGVESWTLNIVEDGNKTVKTFNGDILPEKIIWDGRDNNGNIAEGVFKAEYKVVYTKGNEPESITKEFSVDITPPEIAVNLEPMPFSPDNDGVADELHINLDVNDMSAIKSWNFEIADREGNSFTSFSGNGKPTEQIIWDGIGNNGELVMAAEDYAYRFTVDDVFGNKDAVYGIIPVDVLVVKEGDQLKIRIANITFAPDSAQLRADDPEIKAKNEYVLGRLSEILQKYDSYKIKIEGHAVSVYWDEPARAAVEEREELIPLSKARAETVKKYLEQLGVNESRMSTEGLGGKKPLVPHGDLDNRWKNRRVEFILIK
ncbi:MAG: FlgD immunoglobulin-like domain containing protein [Spirochaetales bacterium]|nr:FlgD immunoglobulin-like domain containing protein [Spirochaetales bacterium]